MTWVECIPNFSSAKPEFLHDLRQCFHRHAHVHVLHVDANTHINRSVWTLLADWNALLPALSEALDVCMIHIDMSNYASVHPHVGALDVLPVVVFDPKRKNAINRELKAWSCGTAQKYDVPIFWYAHSSSSKKRKALSQYRRGNVAGLNKRLSLSDIKADAGPNKLHPKLGAIVVGVRDLMVAYNINLPRDQLLIAKEVASEIRSSNPSSPFAELKAIGWLAEDFDLAQISTNIYHVVSGALPRLYHHCERLVGQKGGMLVGSELIGLVPALALQDKGHHSSQDSLDITRTLGLNACKIFDPEQHILDVYLKQYEVEADLLRIS